MERTTTCPFCLGNETEHVCDVPIKGTEKTRSLWKFTRLSRWFWEDTGEEEESLCSMCETVRRQIIRAHALIFKRRFCSVMIELIQASYQVFG